MGLPVTVVDYLPPKQAGKAKEIATKIADLGFNPWVTNGMLTKLYLYNVENIPRKILLFYSGQLNNVDERIGSYVSRAIAMPLNYMGYVTELYDINGPFRYDISPDDYAGIVVAIDGFLLGRESELYDWYLTIIQKKIPMVILNSFGFPLDSVSLKPFHLVSPLFSYAPHGIKTVFRAPMMGYEISPVPRHDSFIRLKAQEGTILYKLADDVGAEADKAAIMPWGGYYLSSNFLVPLMGGNYRWSINPFQFFKQALRLPDMPIPDTTTENARRLMFVHIDGDGFANKGMWYKGSYVGDILRKEFLKRYSIPTTVSIIQGEIAANGMHPDLTVKLEKIARQIFKLPYVEIASHTFSHPYNWRRAAKYKGSRPNPYILPIPNYHFNLNAEITGSVDYINKNLAPVGKACRMFLWSGEGDVPEEALKLVSQLGIGNLNPGKIITKSNQSVSGVSALGLNEGPYFQVFAPIGNDDETISHSKVFYSLVGIVEALQYTEEPHRLKPIDIYYHFYSVSQLGGIKALHEVYHWALSQPVMNIYASDYYNKVIDFNELAIAKTDGGWLLETNDQLRELRMSVSMGYPSLEQSRNVIGYSLHYDDLYIHLGPGGESFIRLTPKPTTLPYLVDSNAKVSQFVRENTQINFVLDGYLPPKFTFANMRSCTLFHGQEQIMPQSVHDDQKTYEFKHGTNYELSIQCN